MSSDRLNAFQQYIATQPVQEHRLIQATLRQLSATRKEVREIIGPDAARVVCIGFTSIWFVPRVESQTLIWCVNGIPEEKSLTSRWGFLVARMQWIVTRWLKKPSLVVVVSSEMGKLVAHHMPGIQWVAVPTCVDLSTFRSSKNHDRSYFTYLGTGAPWQALHLLSALWGQLYQLDNSIRFRVISRDDRCRILGSRLPAEAISFVSSNDFKEVAGWLHESEVGFLVRRDNVINRVSYPTKLAEYLAAGAWIVSSDFPWVVREHLQQYHCGIVIGQPDRRAAEEILSFRKKSDRTALAKAIRDGADALDREKWVNFLVTRLQSLQ